MDEANSKVYIEIVKKIRGIIDKDRLKPGDRIPSERELSERLHAGRSSVREALRALELLGLIETRRGEGTFLRDARGNQLVQLLSTFILQDDRAKNDVKETKYLVEMDCLRLLLDRNNGERLEQFRERIVDQNFTDKEFFQTLADIADNFLLYRIWNILSDYYHSLNMKERETGKEPYLSLVDALLANDKEKALEQYRRLRNI